MPAKPSVLSQTTKDAFLDGRVHVVQPLKGFRSGLDSVLLAASVNSGSTNILELGAGAGTVICCVLADLPKAHAILAERQSDMVTLAHRNLQENGLSKRARALELDVMAKGEVRLAAGLHQNEFTSVIANPPFFDAESSSHPPGHARAKARLMPEDHLDLWVRTAAACAAPKGEIIFIHSAAILPKILTSFSTRFGNIHVLPIQPRSGLPASRVLVRGIKGSRAPLKLLPAMILHGENDSAYLPVSDQIFRGSARLDW